jgi:hypothetical protein
MKSLKIVLTNGIKSGQIWLLFTDRSVIFVRSILLKGLGIFCSAFVSYLPVQVFITRQAHGRFADVLLLSE